MTKIFSDSEDKFVKVTVLYGKTGDSYLHTTPACSETDKIESKKLLEIIQKGAVIEYDSMFCVPVKFEEKIDTVEVNIVNKAGAFVSLYSSVELFANLSVSPVDDETMMLGKKASELQNGVKVGENDIVGTLKSISGYTGYSNIPEEQSGHYLALKHVRVPSNAKLTAELTGSEKGPKELKSNDMVVRVTNKDTQKLKFVVTNPDTEENKTIEYDLSKLVLE